MRIAALLLIIATATAAACTPSHPATTTTAAHDAAVAAWHNVTECFRAHGFAVPDATIDDAGNASFPPDVPRTPEDVIAACQAVLAQLPNADVDSGPTPEQMQARREFAQCMRDHGVTAWPDPGPDGRFPDSPQLAAEGKTPTLVQAQSTCGHFLASPSPHH